ALGQARRMDLELAAQGRARPRRPGCSPDAIEVTRVVTIGVVPQPANADERGLVRLLGPHELSRELDDPTDVIRVDVGDHDQIERHRLARGQPELALELPKPGPERA